MTRTAEEIEAELRESWTRQGVPREKQDAILKEVEGKAQLGAKIGPFTIGKRGTHNRKTYEGRPNMPRIEPVDNCGCRLGRNELGIECPLHEHAKDILDSLIEMRDAIKDAPQYCGGTTGEFCRKGTCNVCAILKRAEQNILDAGGALKPNRVYSSADNWGRPA